MAEELAQESLASSSYSSLQSSGEGKAGRGEDTPRLIEVQLTSDVESVEEEGGEEVDGSGVSSEEQQGGVFDSSGGNNLGVEDEEDQEDLELLAELKELYKGINSSMFINISSESLNSSVSDDPERLRRKVEQLQRNVQDWKESYDLLMKELRKLSLERVVEREELVREVKVLSTDAKDLQHTIRRLEFELGEHRKLLNRADSMNKYLLKEVNSLRKERGMKEVELNNLSSEIDALRDTEEDRLAREKLKQVLEIIDRGVKEGMLKLSELDLGKQKVPFPLEDVSVGSCTCGPILQRYKEELEHVRQEVQRRTEELEMVRKELDPLQREHQATSEELAQLSDKLQEVFRDKAALQEELTEEKKQRVVLKSEVQALEEELRASQWREQSLDDSLQSASDSLRHVEDLTEQRISVKETELAHVKSELSELEKRHQWLEKSMEASRLHVDQLERAERSAQMECEALREELEEWKAKERHITEIAGEKERVQRKLDGMMAELDSQVKLAEQYKASLATVQQLHCKCQEEAGKLRASLLAKETDLSRVLTTLQLTSSQISALRRRGERSPRSSPSSGVKSPQTVARELADCNSLVQGVEQELRAHMKQWEALHEASMRDTAAISQLTVARDQLEEELREKTRTVKHLEGLLQEVGVSQHQMQDAVKQFEGRIQSLMDELEFTRSNYKVACKEIAELKEELLSLGNEQEHQQLLVMELEKHNETIRQIQSREKEVELEYQTCLERFEAAESARRVLEGEHKRVLAELLEQERLVEQLEKNVADEKHKREVEVGGLEELLKREQERWDKDVTASSQVIRELEEELKAKTGQYEDQHLQYRELEGFLEEKVKALESLRTETDFLNQQYMHTKNEVEHSQQLVESLQEDLASSKGQCDGLQQVVKEYEERLENLTEELHTNMEEKLTLQDKVAVVMDQMSGLRQELDLSSSRYALLQQEKQDEITNAQERVLEAEKSHTNILRQLSQLELCLQEEREKELEKEEIAKVMEEQDVQVAQLQEALGEMHTIHEEKEKHWQSELVRLSSELELSQQRLVQLEKDLVVKEEDMAALEMRLVNSQRMQDLAKQEVSSSQQFEDTLKRQLDDKRAQVVDLENALAAHRGEVATVKGQLAASEEGRSRLQQRLAEQEEEHARLLQCHFEAEQELRTLEHNLEERTEQNKQLQEDCRDLTEQISSISKGERSANDTLVQRIRDLDSQLASLKAAHNDLELRNDLLMQANNELKAQMSTVNLPPEDDDPPIGSLSSLNGGGGSSVTLSVNVVTNVPATTSVTTGTSTVGVASTRPIKFDSQYRRSMETGLQLPPLDFPGSETESEAALDKEYWVNRAGELSIQLQQSSEYWAQKVRELSIDLEKQRQVPRHVD